MVVITEDPPEGLKVQENGVAGGAGASDMPVMSITMVGGEEDDGKSQDAEEDDMRNYWDDDDDVYQEFEELDFDSLLDNSDALSIASGDSFYPPDHSLSSHLCHLPSPEPISFFKACCGNNAIIVKVMIRQGVTEEEVRETDKNRRSGLIVACYKGYVDVVIALAQCPYVDVNWQDKEGNTALMTAVQAGHIIISNYLLNYFPCLDIEKRNCHGFTAMMKAAMQGRAECVRALMLAGADVEARDYGRKMTSWEWALFTCRYETAHLMERLMAQPCAEQFCDSYPLEWPMLKDLVMKANAPKSCWKHLTNYCLCCPFTFYFDSKVNPVDDGVLDHMVRLTTSLSSPLITTACHTVCPGSPPCVGKRRYAVQEILRKQRVDELRRLGPERLNNYKRFFQNSRVLLVTKKPDRRSSLQPQLLRDMATASTGAMRRASLLPLNMMRRSSVRPGLVVPKVRLCKAPVPNFTPDKNRGKNGDYHHLMIPKWNYKMKKEERKMKEDKQRVHPMTGRR